MADHLAIGRLARRLLALRVGKLRPAELEPGFGLGDVGAGQVADLETVAGRFEVGLEHLDVVGVQFDDRAVADDIHVGRDREHEHVAFDRPQGCAPRFDPRLRGLDRILDTSAVVQGVTEVDPGRERRTLAAGVEDSASAKVAVEADGAR